MRGRAKVVPTIFILIVSSFFLPCIRGSSGYLDVTASEAKSMIDSTPLLVVLDVRTQSEYNSEHIRNARLIPVTELEARISKLDENRETLVYCRSGGRSVAASQILIDHGFSQVYNMVGGILAWMDEGYPVYVRYTSIQEVINNASDGDTIFVSPGIYNEHLVVNRSLVLVGENRDTTVIDGGIEGTVIYVKATNSVSIRDFTLRRSGCACKGYSGIRVENSHSVYVTNNRIVDNGFGIKIDSSYETIVTRNHITDNYEGIEVRSSFGNVFYHNSFVDNHRQAVVTGEPDAWVDGELNTWDDGCPCGGNYWSDYTSIDLFSDPHQNETGSDGISDTPYIIDENDQDNYPLMGMFSNFSVIWEEQSYHVNVISNSTVSDFDFGVIHEPEIRKEISFNVTGQNHTIGFCRVMIPTELMNSSYTVLVNGEDVNATLLDSSNSTYTYLYFTYKLSTKRVVIIPEFPSALTFPLLAIVTLIAVVVMKYKHSKKKTRLYPYAHVSFYDEAC